MTMVKLMAGAAALALMSSAAAAQIAVSANDGKVKLVDGVVQTIKDGKDTVTFIDLSASPPKIVASLDAPASVVGPPTSVAITPNGHLALVTAAEKVDPADATKRIWDDKLTVIDMQSLQVSLTQRLVKAVRGASAAASTPPKIVATLTVGKGAAGVSINKAGTLALVANRGEGTISVLTIESNKVAVAGKVDLGNDKSGPSAVSFLPDGKSALVTMDGESANKLVMLDIDGSKVTLGKREINAGLRPYGLDIAKSGDFAVVANIGRGGGDADTISLIDLKANPPRVVNTVTVGQTPEGIKLSPDGRFAAVSVMNGSNKPQASPFYNAAGLVKLYKTAGNKLVELGQVSVGKWCQGLAWSANNKTLLVQCMAEQELHVIKVTNVTGTPLTKTSTLKVQGGPAGIRTAE
jgi:DNA-binding beta-propeller fold protein YncE